MNISRRFFIGGAASFGALAGCRAFRAPVGALDAGVARLTFGVISDVHVAEGEGDFKKFGDNRNLIDALTYFRAQGVDGVMLAGDMADNGMRNQLRQVGAAWRLVFPDNRTAEGKKVEKLFVYGNHDLEGQLYDGYAERFHERASFERDWICKDPARAWEEAFDEPFAPIWTKEVNGYRFIGAHWKRGKWDGISEIEPYMASLRAKIDPKLPFFYVQHPHPKATCHLGHAWGEDAGYARRALNPFPNAVAFSGHSHTSLTDPSAIWQGEFTSLGTASLRYGGGGFPQPSGRGYENGGTPDMKRHSQMLADASKLMGDEQRGEARWGSRQGLLVSVYDDRIVYHRRDFVNGEALGDDWVMPLPAAEAKPFAPEANRALRLPPKFPAGAALTISAEKRKPRKGEAAPALVLSFPAATADPLARAFDYEIVGEQEGEVVFRRHVYDTGFSFSARRAARRIVVPLAKADLPKGPLTLKVRPRNVNGIAGDALSAT